MSEVLEHLIARKDLSEEQAEQTLEVSQQTRMVERHASLHVEGGLAYGQRAGMQPGNAPHGGGVHTMVP